MGSTLKVLEKERMIYDLIHELFQEIQRPFSIPEFEEAKKEKYQHEIKSVRDYFRGLETRNYIQQVFEKKTNENDGKRYDSKHYYTPVNHRIPHDERTWETKEEEKKAFIQRAKSMPLADEKDMYFYFYMINSYEYTKDNFYKSTGNPLLKAVRKKDGDYHRFVQIVTPYLSYLFQKPLLALTHRLGLNGEQVKMSKDIATLMGVTPNKEKEYYADALRTIEKIFILHRQIHAESRKNK